MPYGDEVFISERIDAENEEKYATSKSFTVKGEHIEMALTQLPMGYTMLFPQSFKLMDSELKKIKYPMEARPSYIYTNIDTTVNFCFEIFPAASTVMVERIEQYKAIIKRMNPTSIPLFSDVISVDHVNANDIGYFCYRSTGLDTDIYNVVFVADSQKNELYASFNCPYEDSKLWKKIVYHIIESLRPQMTL